MSSEWNVKQSEKHAAELELAGEAFRSAFEHAPIGMALIASDGRYFQVNEVLAGMLGYARDELLAVTFRTLTHPEDLEYSNEAFENIATGRVDENRFEKRYVHRNGQAIWVVLASRLHRDERGQPLYVIVQVVDISERKRAQEALRASEERFRALFDNAPIGVYRTTPAGEILHANPALLKMVGYSSLAELKKRNLKEEGFGPNYNRRAFCERLEREGLIKGLEGAWRKKDGSLVFVRENAKAVRNAEGRTIYYDGTAEDITQRKRAEDLLRIERDLGLALGSTGSLRQACDRLLEAAYRIEGIDCGGVYLVDESSGELNLVAHRGLPLEFINHASHYEPDALHTALVMKGKPIYGLLADIAPARDATLQHAGLRALAVIPVHHEKRVVAALNVASHTRDEIPGSARHALEAIAAQLGGVAARIRAEQEKTELESQLRQAQKMEAIGQLAGGVAHDFNNILTAILGNSELLRERLQAGQRCDEVELTALQQIDRAAQRAAALTRRLLAFSRRQVVKPEVLDLNRVLSELKSMLRRLIHENVVLEIIPGADLPRIRADVGQIEQVVLNLVVNARDAMPDGGALRLETVPVTLDEHYAATHAGAQPGCYVMLAISDTGCGMSRETREHIFEPFFTTKPVGQGTGLGLATVYGIVQQAGGHVTVESELGQGTRISVYLPVVAALATEYDAAGQTGRIVGGDETILVCEDDGPVRDLASQALKRAGYRVLTAENGKEAVKLASKHRGPLDMLVTDVIMPGINGKTLADRMTAAYPGLRTLFVSGYPADVIAPHGVLAGGVELLKKPFTAPRLQERVRTVLDRAQGRE
ncbi:MAG: PAS domain S-box protein [Phycisphaerae bacterium]|nr:PAS domain S-box protein [Phycisphaerae bacterium]